MQCILVLSIRHQIHLQPQGVSQVFWQHVLFDMSNINSCTYSLSEKSVSQFISIPIFREIIYVENLPKTKTICVKLYICCPIVH